MGGGKRRGVENLTNDTPPKRGFGPPLLRYVFHPPRVSVLCFPVQKSTTEQTRSSFGGVQKCSGERVLWYVSPPPHTFCTPPYHRPRQKFKDVLLQNYFGFSLLLCIQHATDGSMQLIEVDPISTSRDTSSTPSEAILVACRPKTGANQVWMMRDD